jgi:hypothetical protein
MHLTHPFILPLVQVSLLQEICQVVVVILNHEASSHEILYEHGQCINYGKHILIIYMIELLWLPQLPSLKFYGVSILHQHCSYPLTRCVTL